MLDLDKLIEKKAKEYVAEDISRNTRKYVAEAISRNIGEHVFVGEVKLLASISGDSYKLMILSYDQEGKLLLYSVKEMDNKGIYYFKVDLLRGEERNTICYQPEINDSGEFYHTNLDENHASKIVKDGADSVKDFLNSKDKDKDDSQDYLKSLNDSIASLKDTTTGVLKKVSSDLDKLADAISHKERKDNNHG